MRESFGEFSPGGEGTAVERDLFLTGQFANDRFKGSMRESFEEFSPMSTSQKDTTATTAEARAPFVTLLSPGVLKWVILLLPLAGLWFELINNLRLEWATDPQYGYGLVVPFLCVGLLIRRWHDATGCEVRKSTSGGLWPAVWIFAFLAFLYLPTRLVEAATPEWRPIQWMLGIIAIGLTLCVIGWSLGPGWLRQMAFPICLFFVAIPWPTLFEQPIIQNLTRVSATIVIELLGWLDVPAIAHGNVIEVSTGMVGIDEACSGIRSFQSSLMISLFLGEFYRLSTGRRWLLVPLGFAFSMAFNICRMLLLTLIAAKKGVGAISEYHDPTGVTIAILCTLTLWMLALSIRNRRSADHKSANDGPPGKTDGENQKPIIGALPINPGTFDTEQRLREDCPNPPHPNPLPGEREPAFAQKLRPGKQEANANCFSGSIRPQQVQEVNARIFRRIPSPLASRLALALLIWLGLVEIGVQAWYHSRESHLKPGPDWTLTFPPDNPTLKDIPMDAKTQYLLRFDEAKQAAWREADGTHWEAFYFDWFAGRVAGYLAKRHTPEICLTATGLKLLSGPTLTIMKIHGVDLPIRSYQFQTEDGVLQVFHCRWEAGASDDAFVAHESSRYNLIRSIWEGRGDQGQKVLEFIISGMNDPEQAKQALAGELDKLIKVEKSATSS
jgi:exosortase